MPRRAYFASLGIPGRRRKPGTVSGVIRPLEKRDYPAIARIWRELRPDAVHSEQALQRLIETFPERAAPADWVAEADGELVGWAFAHRRWWRASNTAFIWIGVSPAARGRGIGSAFWDAGAEHIRSLGVDEIHTNVVGDAAGADFARKRGFALAHTDIVSAVDPARVDVSELAALRSRIEADGYRIVPYGELDPQAIYEVDVTTSDDMPGDDTPHEVSFEEWKTEVYEGRDVTLEGSFAVMHGDTAVAHTMLSVDWGTSRARNEGTGTLREHRRRGLALTAKLEQMRWAAEQGIGRVITDNAEENAGMLAINRRLGYEPFVDRTRWILSL
jgi:GNAT superfamily N-acetyltransferase